MAFQQFPNCQTAAKFVDFTLGNTDYKSYKIFINRTDGTMGELTDNDIRAFIQFEADPVRLTEKVSDIHGNILKYEDESSYKKQARDIAMDWIRSMDPHDFECRLLNPRGSTFKLPDFPRAISGDVDFPDHRKPVRETNAFFSKRRLTGKDIEFDIINFANANREFLRYMSEKDFIALCYEEEELVVADLTMFERRIEMD
jgi:hypothetical protein